MNTPTLGLAALLMLGGASIAVAQDDGPRESLPAPAQGLERGPTSASPGRDGPGARGVRDDASDAGRGAEAPDEGPGDERLVEGPDPEVRKDAPEAEPSGAERTDGMRTKEKERAQEREGDKGGEKPTKDAKEGDRRTRADTRDKAADTSKDEPRAKRDAQTKPDRERAKDDGGRDAADADRAQPADTGRAAETDRADRGKGAEGDRMAPERAKKADLSGEKRARVSSAFRESRDVKRRTDVDIDISVGTRLPGDWEFVPVPSAVVEVVPEYRGYAFTYVDDEYVILDPETYEVVAVLPAGDGPQYAGGSGGGGAAERCSETLTLGEEERDYIVRSIQITDEVDVSGITVGWSVPGEIELRQFPQPVISRVGQLASCRYFVAEDQIAIVDPAEETVVLLIDHD